jgi:hypothetical protein
MTHRSETKGVSLRICRVRNGLRLFAGALAILSGGCSFIEVNSQSFARMTEVELFGQNPPEGKHRPAIWAMAGNEWNFTLWGIIIPPIIPYWDTERYKEGFWITVTVMPQSWADAFDPGELLLETDEGELIATKGYVGPGDNYFVFRDSRQVKNLRTNDGPFAITKQLSVGVLFPIDTFRPGRQFSLILKGFHRSGKVLEPVKMKFHKNSNWHLSYTVLQLDPHGGPNFSKDWVVNE